MWKHPHSMLNKVMTSSHNTMKILNYQSMANISLTVSVGSCFGDGPSAFRQPVYGWRD